MLRVGGRLHLIEHTRGDLPPIGWALDLATPVWQRIAGGCRLNRDPEAMLPERGWAIVRKDVRLGGLFKLLVALPA